MVTFESSVQASNDDIFKHIQKIAQLNYQMLIYKPELVDKFLTLCTEKFNLCGYLR